MDYVFFFKQKTAYEVRIRDWSSDVCSSDLGITAPVQLLAGGPYCRTLTFSSVTRPLVIRPSKSGMNALIFSSLSTISMTRGRSSDSRRIFVVCSRLEWPKPMAPRSTVAPAKRSEEHTSELQSLMRISYAVFCLKKKKNKHH